MLLAPTWLGPSIGLGLEDKSITGLRGNGQLSEAQLVLFVRRALNWPNSAVVLSGVGAEFSLDGWIGLAKN